MSVLRDAIIPRAWGWPPGGVGIGGAGLASLHCRLLTSWAAPRHLSNTRRHASASNLQPLRCAEKLNPEAEADTEGRQKPSFWRVFNSTVSAGGSAKLPRSWQLSLGAVDASTLAAYINFRRSLLASNWRLTAKPTYSLTYRSASAYQTS